MIKRMLLTATVVLPLLTANAAKEETKNLLSGEHANGPGYSIYFDEEKTKSIEVNGFAAYDLNAASSSKLRNSYFRFYITGNSGDWSFNTRFDKNMSFFQNNDTQADGTVDSSQPSAIYFARAYVTRKFTENYSASMGRMINIHKWDVHTGAFEIAVDESVQFDYNRNNFNMDLMVTYMDASTQMSESYPFDTYNLRDYYISGLVTDYTIESGDLSLNVSYSNYAHWGYEGQKLMQHFVGLYLTTKNFNGLYVLNSYAMKGYSSAAAGETAKAEYSENYFEAGFDINEKLSADVYLMTHLPDGANTFHDLGADLIWKHTTEFNTQWSVEAGDVTENANATAEVAYTHRLRATYNF